MPTPSDAFQRAAFDGIEFPCSDISVKGGMRHHVHEFPHADGGEPEKMGRKLYEISMTAYFHDVPGSDLDRNYPQLYPTRLRQLRQIFDTQATKDLVIPTIGTIKAFATDWEQKYNANVLSGETFTLKFLEDQEGPFANVDELDAPTIGSLVALNDELFAKMAILDFQSVAGVGLFQKINDVITDIQGGFDQGNAYSNLVAGKIESLALLIGTADRDLKELQDPVNHEVLEALKDLWVAAVEIKDNVVQPGMTIKTYVTGTRMSITQVATTIYGDSERAAELLQLNAIEDAFAIPAGFTIRFMGGG